MTFGQERLSGVSDVGWAVLFIFLRPLNCVLPELLQLFRIIEVCCIPNTFKKPYISHSGDRFGWWLIDGWRVVLLEIKNPSRLLPCLWTFLFPCHYHSLPEVFQDIRHVLIQPIWAAVDLVCFLHFLLHFTCGALCPSGVLGVGVVACWLEWWLVYASFSWRGPP